MQIVIGKCGAGLGNPDSSGAPSCYLPFVCTLRSWAKHPTEGQLYSGGAKDRGRPLCNGTFGERLWRSSNLSFNFSGKSIGSGASAISSLR